MFPLYSSKGVMNKWICYQIPPVFIGICKACFLKYTSLHAERYDFHFQIDKNVLQSRFHRNILRLNTKQFWPEIFEYYKEYNEVNVDRIMIVLCKDRHGIVVYTQYINYFVVFNCQYYDLLIIYIIVMICI